MYASETSESVITGNTFDKYRTRNPLFRRLMEQFLGSARALVRRANPTAVVEVGCGPGDLARSLFCEPATSIQLDSYVGIDIGEDEVATAQAMCPDLEFRVASAYDLPFDDRSADLVIACEVLEHLTDPSRALSEIVRVSRRHVLVSVPWEPTWRCLNLLRGKYITSLGNTPGHIQHFSRRAIKRLVSAQFEIVAVETPFPWTMILAQKR